MNQEKTSKTIAHGPQRIYGIVGSGKIVRLTQKAVHMHLKYPNRDITLMLHPLASRSEHLADQLLVTGLQQGRHGIISADAHGRLWTLRLRGTND